jgi:hypothetical protein
MPRNYDHLTTCWEYTGRRGRKGHVVAESFAAYRLCELCPSWPNPWHVYVCNDCGGAKRAHELYLAHIDRHLRKDWNEH